MKIGAFITGCSSIALSEDEMEFVRQHNPWGLIVFARNVETPEQLSALAHQFRHATGRADAPVFVDQEGGRVQRLRPPHWRKFPPAKAFSVAYQSDAALALKAAHACGRLMGEELAATGITADCLPVLDVPQPGSHDVIGDRAYGMGTDEIIPLANAHTGGLIEAGVLPVIKHIPGHGRAMVDSHKALPAVDASYEELRSTDFATFKAFAKMPMAMTAHVVYRALDGNRPATLSPVIIDEVIRKEIGFDGLLMTDDLNMGALSGTLAERVEAAREAGCDMMLHCNGLLEDMQVVAEAAGELAGRALDRAHAAQRFRRLPVAFDVDEAEELLAKVTEIWSEILG